ncbi:MAG: PRTRC system protein C [Candidatus Marinimicrobia bacterium]|jgi:PRTRC genetic system protein C|nr:PRTRC system protein C [Candidatus Neomarinimicrobiota bacterium]
MVETKRIFIYDGREFDDPDPKMKVDEIRTYYANFFPELVNAEWQAAGADKKKTGIQYFEFKRKVGIKGLTSTPEKMYAFQLWTLLNQDEKNLIRFGMFPLNRMTAAPKELDSRLLCVALMDIAKIDGGMIA